MDVNTILRKLPQVDEILKSKDLSFAIENMPHDFLVKCIREVIDNTRENVLKGNIKDISEKEIVSDVLAKINNNSRPSLRQVINATGTVLHTNLGRAVISKKATEAIIDVAHNYSNLEYDIEKGERGDRQSHIEKLITDITGCESAMVVNNNAAATVIVLATLAFEKEVIISRGELIEIGGSFRIPDVMSQSRAILKEIGTTNKTKLSDYKNAIKEGITGAIMKVHTSNYKVVGFTEEATLKDLVPLGNEHDIPVIYDMGNGLFVDLNEYGIDEPTVPNLVKENADVILFSGDKLLGGPQAGIIIGKAKYIDKMKKHPLARAFRVDKFTIAGLTATLFEYYDTKKAKKNIPILDMITVTKDELKQKATIIKNELAKNLKDVILDIEEVKDQVGGGTAPDVYLDGYAVSILTKKKSIDKLENDLRILTVPIIPRIAHDKLYIDVRTILENDIKVLIDELLSVLN